MESNIKNALLTRNQQMLIVKLGLLLGIDLLFSLLAVTFFVPREHFLGDYLPIVSLTLICLLPCIIIFVRWKQVNQFILYGILFVMLILGIYIFSGSWWLLVLFLLFIHWRFGSHFQNEENQIEINSGIVLVFILLSTLSLIYSSVNELGNSPVIYSLLFFLLSFIATGTAIQRMMNQPPSHSKIKKQLLKPFVVLMTVILVGGVVLFFVPFIRTGFYWGVQKIFWALSFLVDPIFGLLLKIRDWLMSMISRETLDGMGIKLDTPVESVQQNAFYEGVSIPWLKGVLFGIFLLIVIIYILKMRRITLDADDDEVSESLLSTFKQDYKEENKEIFTVSYSDASNTIRKSMKSLEKEASSANLGRYFNEDVRKWFSRMGITEEEPFYALYENVRYGIRDPSQQEVDYFTNQIEHHIGELKEREDQ
ncbi:hypothetical protein NQ095_12140 [Rossellomorea sp. SC111]|uniref:hypothetical protein n=1 Tax=Rossellomorea sp. SC111 TaxID=2968985 RepID=UPI00215B29A2|nr:hypothetical protein [Rossellomorea sp. SC111]MCR8849163.1 hypothetical protein [Rossellomorea sp. SC111]